MIPVTISVDVSDACDANPTCKITTVFSDEAVGGTGDGDTSPDWVITGDLTLDLRAERSGQGGGRVYTITIECTDVAGNPSTRDLTVTVPPDQDKGGSKQKKRYSFVIGNRLRFAPKTASGWQEKQSGRTN